MHIAIAGNIGAGKTTLTSMLSAHYGWTAFFEQIEENPYISDFYESMKQWSFHLQIHFLQSRFKHLSQINAHKNTTVQDRTIYEDACIFARNLYEMDLMEERDFNNYFSLYQEITSLLPLPDLLIYLKASVPTLVNHIQRRGRAYEESIRLDYLKHLNDKYNEWIFANYKGACLTIDIDKIDFERNPNDFEHITKLIEHRLSEL